MVVCVLFHSDIDPHNPNVDFQRWLPGSASNTLVCTPLLVCIWALYFSTTICRLSVIYSFYWVCANSNREYANKYKTTAETRERLCL